MRETLTIWQQMVTPHVLPLASALREHFACVRFVTLNELDPERTAIGWGAESAPGVQQLSVGDFDSMQRLLRDRIGERDFHILPGIKPAAWLWRVQRLLWRTPAQLLLMSESPWPRPRAMGTLLFLRDRSLAYAWAQRARLMFAIGQDAAIHFRRCGFPSGKIKPFGYFPALRSEALALQGHTSGGIVVAATLMRHKGIDLLLEALGQLRGDRWTLTVAGDGPEREALQRQAAALGISDRIAWLGWVPAKRVPSLISQAALAVIPSRYDGWGAVTNEALAQGTPVIISDGAGSHCLIAGERGTVVPGGHAMALAGAIKQELRAPGTPDRYRAISQWAAGHISPKIAAEYLVSIARNPDADIPSPWSDQTPTGIH